MTCWTLSLWSTETAGLIYPLSYLHDAIPASSPECDEKTSSCFSTGGRTILSYLLGPWNSAGTLSTAPRKQHRIPHSVIEASFVDNTGRCSGGPDFVKNMKEWLAELILGPDHFRATYWNQEDTSIKVAMYHPAQTPHKESVFYPKTLVPPTSHISVIRHNESFALYNFETQALILLDPHEPEIFRKFSIRDLSFCRTSKNNKWLWDTSTMKRYDLTSGAIDIYTLKDKEKNLAKNLITHEQATSHNGSLCVSYFPKNAKRNIVKPKLVLWNGNTGTVSKVIPLSPQTIPRAITLSSDGNHLIYEVHSKQCAALEIMYVHDLSRPVKSHYVFNFPMYWRTTEEGGNILVVHGRNNIDFINPSLHTNYSVRTLTSWSTIPLFDISPQSHNLIWCCNDTAKFVELDDLNLSTYHPRHILFSCLLLRAIHMAEKVQKKLYAQSKLNNIVVNLHKKIPAYHDFMRLPRELAQFFLATYGEPCGPLRVQGQSPSPHPADAWEKILC